MPFKHITNTSTKKELIKKAEHKKVKINEKEDSWDRLCREEKEKEAKEKSDKKAAELAAKKEEERKHKIIYAYVEKLDEKLKKTVGGGFWVYPDQAGFKKMVIGINTMQKIIHSDIKKYKGRHLAEFCIKPYHKEHGTKGRLFRDPDTWIFCRITIYKVDDKGDIFGKHKHWGMNWTWKTDDFKITKFSFKLLEFFMHLVDKKIYNFGSISGPTLQFTIDQMKKKGVKFGDVLKPLAGV